MCWIAKKANQAYDILFGRFDDSFLKTRPGIMLSEDLLYFSHFFPLFEKFSIKIDYFDII